VPIPEDVWRASLLFATPFVFLAKAFKGVPIWL
jgi:hypothetical protein